MTYYRVREKCDNAEVWKRSPRGWVFETILVGNELFTEREYERMKGKFAIRGFRDDSAVFEIVQVSPKNTYIMFGARFECRD